MCPWLKPPQTTGENAGSMLGMMCNFCSIGRWRGTSGETQMPVTAKHAKELLSGQRQVFAADFPARSKMLERGAQFFQHCIWPRVEKGGRQIREPYALTVDQTVHVQGAGFINFGQEPFAKVCKQRFQIVLFAAAQITQRGQYS